MVKIKLLRKREARINEPAAGLQNIEPSKFQLEIPGMGRLRTSGRHPNFHAVRAGQAKPEMPVLEKQSIKELVASHQD